MNLLGFNVQGVWIKIYRGGWKTPLPSDIVCSQHHVQFCLIALLIARVHGKVRSLSKVRGTCNQLQNNGNNYVFNKDLYNL